MINKRDDMYCMKQKENLFPKNAAVGLKASASKHLNAHAIYSKQFLNDKINK